MRGLDPVVEGEMDRKEKPVFEMDPNQKATFVGSHVEAPRMSWERYNDHQLKSKGGIGT